MKDLREDASDKAQLAERVRQAWQEFDEGLSNKRDYPVAEFDRFLQAVVAYANASRQDEQIHRAVARIVSGLRESTMLERKRVPGRVIYDADRLEVILFSGYDPHFEGEGPTGI